MGKISLHTQYAIDNAVPTCAGQRLPYIVPYSDQVKILENSRNRLSKVDFVDLWKKELLKASEWFDCDFRCVWSTVLSFVASEKDASGAHPSGALELYISGSGCEAAGTFLKQLSGLHTVAKLNFDIMRKLLRKYDKRLSHCNKEGKTLSEELLTFLYSSNFGMGIYSIEAHMEMLRAWLEPLNDEEEATHEAMYEKSKSELNVQAMNAGEELQWFRESVAAAGDVEAIVAHRGFHDIDDGVARPIENTLASFEYAWTAGVPLCECDVGLTKDGRIVLAHDVDFSRLTLIDEHVASQKAVNDLTFSELMALPLKSGTRPPLLTDVLRSAQAIGEHAKLVIEIKPGNLEIVEPLIYMLSRRQDLLRHIAVIMSFDLFIMKRLCDCIQILNIGQLGTQGSTMSFHTSRKFSVAINRQSVGSFRNSVPIHMPKLLLITESNPKRPHKGLFFDIGSTEACESLETAVDESGIDGIYLQYQPQMLEGKDDTAINLRTLCAHYDVGIWMLRTDPDAISVCRRLSREAQVKYINSDFPRSFFDS